MLLYSYMTYGVVQSNPGAGPTIEGGSVELMAEYAGPYDTVGSLVYRLAPEDTDVRVQVVTGVLLDEALGEATVEDMAFADLCLERPRDTREEEEFAGLRKVAGWSTTLTQVQRYNGARH